MLCAYFMLRLVELSASACKCCVHKLCKGFVLGPSLGKEDLARCAQISYPMRSWFVALCM
jgi:hypothetical protein